MPEAPQGSGVVHLVGAGPGDPSLMTRRALELIARADVIVYDRLIPDEALAGARADAELLYVGKEGGGDSVPQEHTERLLLERARAGATVVRLKGGDPFVFGRGGEEALALRAAGIRYEVVPGVTAGVAASAYAGIPVTHRGLAGAVALVTGRSRDDAPGSLDWAALAAFPGTLVFYMGVSSLPQIASGLIGAGRDAHEPAAIVEAGTLPQQRTVLGSLATIAQEAERARVRAPSITIVGAVAGLAEELAWLRGGPLAGTTVAVTRARAQASGLARRLQELGARVIQAPVIRIEPLPLQPLDPSGYDLVCVTSANAAEILYERLVAGGRDARSLAGAKLAAVGPATAEALARRGLRADVTGERAVAESLLDALADVPVTRALVARAREARDVVPDGLRARGAAVDVLELYRTVAEPLGEREREHAAAADYVTFTSSSTVRHFLSAIGSAQALSPGTRLVSIGPVTSSTLREHGLEAHVEAERHDVDGVVAALLADVAGAGTARASSGGTRT
ncbi:MAG TPA: uroporphyrinogen-III C-methyltransferase [Solirubrobacteraceae bacterium]|nr:uroporphyrinogen-III C-methyltransferase [Solirubrobacteraceae bacterium]